MVAERLVWRLRQVSGRHDRQVIFCEILALMVLRRLLCSQNHDLYETIRMSPSKMRARLQF